MNHLTGGMAMMGFPEMIMVLIAWLIPLLFFIWIIITLNGIRRGIERIADSIDATANTRGTSL
jgi:hypothetical protein